MKSILVPFRAKLVIRNLSYTYPGSTEPALQNINFTLEAGETLAIVGYNGSGMFRVDIIES